MSDFIVQGNTGGYYDSDGHFVLREEYDLTDPVTKYAGGESDVTSEIAFEIFFDALQEMKYLLTSNFSYLQIAGLSPDQTRWIDFFRYNVMKVMDVFKLHPLYAVVYGEDDYNESSS